MTTHEPGGRSVPPYDDEHDDTTALTRVRGPQQLLAVLPQMMGYHPDHSLVLVVTAASSQRQQRRPATVILSCRLDIPALEELHDAVEFMAPVLRQAISSDPDEIRLLHVFGYDLPEEDHEQINPALVSGLRAAMLRLADEAQAHLFDLLLVRGQGRSVREVVTGGEDLDPLPGWSPALDPLDVPAAADLALHGLAALDSRDDLVALVRRRDHEAAAATGLALSLQGMQEPPHFLEGLAPLASWVLDGQEPTARERAVITRVLADRWARDVVLARWLPSSFVLSDVLDAVLDQEAAAEVCRSVGEWEAGRWAVGLDRLLTLVGQVPSEHTAPLLTITGLMAWSAGEGTIANEACDLALEVDPDYVMAQLLMRTLAHGVRPPMSRHRGAPGPGARPDRRPAA